MSEATNMIISPDVTFTPEQMAVVNRIVTRMFDAEAQVADLRAQVERRDEKLTELRKILDSVPVAQLCRQYGIEPMVTYKSEVDAAEAKAWLQKINRHFALWQTKNRGLAK